MLSVDGKVVRGRNWAAPIQRLFEKFFIQSFYEEGLFYSAPNFIPDHKFCELNAVDQYKPLAQIFGSLARGLRK